MGKAMLVEGVDYFFENGLFVLTESYLKSIGICCGNGCRNCPFDFEKVKEPKRSWLREQRKNEQEFKK